MTPSAPTETTRIPGVYAWQPPGKAVAIRVSLDVVDRMLQEVMRGFGAVPKRGAEVGGILLGRVHNSGEKTIVTIDDFEAVAIEYKRGPSYLLSEDDARTFAIAVERSRAGANPLLRPMGYFRSHTREGIGLSAEDLALLDLHFAQPESVALIIKPYATKVSEAGFYFKEDGRFQSGRPLLEFPFRRRDLDPESAPAPRSARQHERSAAPPPQPPAPPTAPPPMPAMREHRALGFEPGVASRHFDERSANSEKFASPSLPETVEKTHMLPVGVPAEPPSAGRSWMWVPVSLVFLLLGVLGGFEAALNLRPQVPSASKEPYNLGVTITKNGNNVQVRWDRQAPAIRAAQKGVLTIEDGAYSRPVALNASDLQSGSVVYPPQANHVRFRLDVVLSDRNTVSEVVDWRQ